MDTRNFNEAQFGVTSRALGNMPHSLPGANMAHAGPSADLAPAMQRPIGHDVQRIPHGMFPEPPPQRPQQQPASRRNEFAKGQTGAPPSEMAGMQGEIASEAKTEPMAKPMAGAEAGAVQGASNSVDAQLAKSGL